MKRAPFLAATGLKVGRYNILRQRDQLPIYSEDSVDEWKNKHREFTVEEAILTRLFVMACDNHGLSPDDANKFAWHAWGDILALDGGSECREDPCNLVVADIWAGWAITRMAEETEMPVRWLWAAGSPADVAEKLSPSRREGDDIQHTMRIVMLNVSDAALFVLHRLREIGELPEVEVE